MKDLEKIIKFISIGDSIKEDKYYIHSKFKNSINFYNDERIITIGNKYIGSGPTNIIFEDISMFNDEIFLYINKDIIQFGTMTIKIDKTKVYDSKINIVEFNIEKFNKNIELFETYVKLLSNGKGISLLLEDNVETNDNLLDKFTLKIRNGVEKLFEGNLIKGIEEIKGVGIGLTPSGDDFIYGFLVGLSIIEIIHNKKLSNLKKLVYENAKGMNLISNNFLYSASEGLFFEKTKNLIFSLFYGDEREILERVTKILQIGETSGVDFSVGLILTLKKGGENVCKRFN